MRKTQYHFKQNKLKDQILSVENINRVNKKIATTLNQVAE